MNVQNIFTSRLFFVNKFHYYVKFSNYIFINIVFVHVRKSIFWVLFKHTEKKKLNELTFLQ